MFQIPPAENSKKPFQSGSFPAQKHNSHWLIEVLWVKIDKFCFALNSHWLRAWVRLEGLLWIFGRRYLKQTLVKFLEKLRNGLVIFHKNKERKKGWANWIRNDKLVIIFFAWRNSLLFQTFYNQSLIKSIQTNIFALKNTLEPR